MFFMYVYGITASVTLFSLFVYFMILLQVSRARKRFNVMAPAVHGPEGFERVHRAQVNTTEQLVLFLPLLWLSAVLVGDLFAGVVGIFWPIARIAYFLTYVRNPNKRASSVGVSYLVVLALFIGSLYGLVTYTQINNSIVPVNPNYVDTTSNDDAVTAPADASTTDTAAPVAPVTHGEDAD